MKKNKKKFEIKIVVFVELFDDYHNTIIHDDDLITFYSLGSSKHEALFYLMKKNLTDFICTAHNLNFSSNSRNYWYSNYIYRYELVDLISISECSLE